MWEWSYITLRHVNHVHIRGTRGNCGDHAQCTWVHKVYLHTPSETMARVTLCFTRTSVWYILIGHELALPRVFLVVTTFLSSCCLKAVHLLFLSRVFLKPIILLFSVGMLGYLRRLPLYYKSLVYYCLGSVVKSPVLYSSYLSQSTSFTLLFVRRSAVSHLRLSSSSQRHRLAFFSCSKSRTHRLDGDKGCTVYIWNEWKWYAHAWAYAFDACQALGYVQNRHVGYVSQLCLGNTSQLNWNLISAMLLRWHRRLPMPQSHPY
jgi:hypothetical protein